MFYMIVYTNQRRRLAAIHMGECDVIDYDVAYRTRFETEEEANEKLEELAEKHNLQKPTAYLD